MPAAIDNVLDAQIELTRHDGSMRLAGELIKEIEADRVDLIVYVEAA